ncbi:9447_t:CDS:2 [Acaulospora morrowiae]|uniref:9447_t:CDS:1 n=1 Tax=Acaulospora morrowiae TaxID=94023 RepID=A0A9N8V3V9_9GLOM|nr:9447_t:CDS:2 [Acaulospora morrowiae]
MARRKKRRTHIPVNESASPNAPKIPKSFVFKSGKVGTSVAGLVNDMRKVMEPHTAINLRERKNNRLKDFVAVAGQLGVTHFSIFTQTENGTNFRLARTPRGPTLCFKVLKYSLIRDILSAQINPKSLNSEFKTPPLLVLNNFGKEKHFELMANMFQSMYPSINMNLADARRVVLFNYNSDTKHIDFRHYRIGVKPVGLSKSVRRIINDHIPDLHGYEDISEYVLREGHVSGSEAESSADETVTLAQDFIGRNNRKSDQRAIKLTEIGPRMELQLVKIQNGLCDGEVLYHEFVHKTPEEVKKMNKKRERRIQQAALRRKEQERNVERKRLEKEAQRLASIKGEDSKSRDRDLYDLENEFSDLEQENEEYIKEQQQTDNSENEVLFKESSDEDEAGSSDSEQRSVKRSIAPKKSGSKAQYSSKRSVNRIDREDTSNDFMVNRNPRRRRNDDSVGDRPKMGIKISMTMNKKRKRNQHKNS